MSRMINDFSDAELAGMIRRSVYAVNTRFGNDRTDARFLLVMAVPYGKDEGVETLAEAIDAFQSLLGEYDWKKRQFQVYDHYANQHYFSASMEQVE